MAPILVTHEPPGETVHGTYSVFGCDGPEAKLWYPPLEWVIVAFMCMHVGVCVCVCSTGSRSYVTGAPFVFFGFSRCEI